MTQCSTLNVKLSSSQLDNLKSGIKNSFGVTFNLSAMWLVILMMELIVHINYY